MKFLFDRNTWQEIYGSIRKNKIRTVITIIGVLWGIFLYIVLAGAAQGLDNGFEEQFKSVAKNSLFVWAESTSKPYGGFKTGRQIRLKLDDGLTVKNKIPEVEYIAPINVKGIFGGEKAEVKQGDKNAAYTIYGYYPVFIKIVSKKIYDNGRFINQDDINESRKVAIIGERTQQELFEEDEDPVGKYIQIDGSYFQVVGVHKFTPSSPFDSDGDIYIPFSTFSKVYNTGNRVSFFTMSAYDNVDIIATEKRVKEVLRKKNNVHPEDERAYGSFNLGDAFDKAIGFAEGITFLSLIVGIATILAGVIGIGNILLISVKERTKELGVRRALGATPKEIMRLIILESVFLTLLAGVLGIILGALVLNGIDNATQSLAFPYNNPTVPVSWVLGALLIMVIMGTLIGLIPAQRAVSIKPIDALREE